MRLKKRSKRRALLSDGIGGLSEKRGGGIGPDIAHKKTALRECESQALKSYHSVLSLGVFAWRGGNHERAAIIRSLRASYEGNACVYRRPRDFIAGESRAGDVFLYLGKYYLSVSFCNSGAVC